MDSSLNEAVRKKIESEFDSSARDEIAELLIRYKYNERERVQLDILHLADGDGEEVSRLVNKANEDYRDIIYWAEYPEESRIDTPEKKRRMCELFKWLGLEVPSYLKESED